LSKHDSNANTDLSVLCDRRLLVKGLIDRDESLSFRNKIAWVFGPILTINHAALGPIHIVALDKIHSAEKCTSTE